MYFRVRHALAILTLLAIPAVVTIVDRASRVSEIDQDDVCCKKCGNEEKPCGDKCIARDKQCSKLPGCACNASRER